MTPTYPAATAERRNAELVARIGPIVDAPGIAEIDSPGVVFAELSGRWREAIVGTPRNIQTRIGPSGMGEPCSIALGYALAGTHEPDHGRVNLKAWVGTSVHAALERIFGGQARYLIEQRVTVGQLDGVDITGSCDLFDVDSGTVVDWKTKGKTTLASHRRHGPGQQYRVQAHLYGLGMVNAGYTVRHVMDVFIPRDGEFYDVCYWAEPWDRQIAEDALTRCEGLLALIGAYGLADALSLFPPCEEPFCAWCATVSLPRPKAAQRLSTIRSQ